jgi:hypothetical protein
MSCSKIEDLLVLYLENKLNPKEKVKVESHLSQCPACQQSLADIKGMIGLLQTVSKKELPENYYDDTELKLEGAQSILRSNPNPFFNPQIYVPVISACIIIVYIISYNNDKPNNEPMPTQAPNCELSKKEISISHETSNKPNNQQKSQPIPELTQEPVSKPVLNQTSTKTLKLAKLNVDESQSTVLRGSNYKPKRIIKQWQDVYSGIKTKETLIIDSQKDWQELWQKHTQNVQPVPSLPDVDFTKNMVIAVFMGEKNTGGYGIHVSKIEETNNNVYIELEETVPSSGTIVSQSFTQPYHIVVVSKE